ncbi:MAG: DUF1343 domain-containing protein [Polyangiaceae bacterium]|nr:DUF1343 domain-containing protein [Polyangiaceae bacterium]
MVPRRGVAVDGASIDQWVASAIREQKLPGAVVVVGDHNSVLFSKAYGNRRLIPSPEPMTLDTIFDLASLTKPLATSLSIMILRDRGLLDLDRPVATYVAEFGRFGKSSITLRDLLLHSSGLPADTDLADFQLGRQAMLSRVYDLKLKHARGERFVYSDVGFLMLEEVVRRVAGVTLDVFAVREIYAPLGLFETQFRPARSLLPRIAPTEPRDGVMLHGEVHDPRAALIGGVAGHAGLFSTAEDLARFAEAVLQMEAGCVLHEKDSGDAGCPLLRLLSRKSFYEWTARYDVGDAIRGLGWDISSSLSKNRPNGIGRRSFGHSGYTGTSLWFDLDADRFVLLLSNRVHPDGKGNMQPLAASLGEAVFRESAMPGADAGPNLLSASSFRRVDPRAIPDSSLPIPSGKVELAVDNFHQLEETLLSRGLKRVALLTNASMIDGHGMSTLDQFARSQRLKLSALLSPEHGLSGKLDEKIKSSVDPKTGLPVHSLYGERLSPTPEMFANTDAVVVDLQDVGVRFYTYASTLRKLMLVCTSLGLPIVVIDRPNPLGGSVLDGPVLQPKAGSFVNHFPLPIRHAMTLGELAWMFDAHDHMGSRLMVLPFAGWNRSDPFDKTGLPWSPPSPNLRSVAQTKLYPGVALLEATNLSVGRGTEFPFEWIGAPWINEAQLLQELAKEPSVGYRFEAKSVTPISSMHAGKECKGIRITEIPGADSNPISLGLTLAKVLHRLYERDWEHAKLHNLIVDAPTEDGIVNDKSVADLRDLWKSDLARFSKKRAKYLLY